jgi:hypothetical protein
MADRYSGQGVGDAKRPGRPPNQERAAYRGLGVDTLQVTPGMGCAVSPRCLSCPLETCRSRNLWRF